MAKTENIKMKGKVTEQFPSSRFKILLDTGHEVQAVISGKIRKNNITIYVGDEVEVEISPYNLSLGRIVYRYK